MVKISHIALITFIILLMISIQANAQWQIVKQLPEKPRKVLNVDVPPTIEKFASPIMSASFTDDLHVWAATDDGDLLQTSDGGNTWISKTIYPSTPSV